MIGAFDVFRLRQNKKGVKQKRGQKHKKQKEAREMTGIVLDGKVLAQQMESELAIRVQRIKDKSNGKPPILATILVGDDPASATYVRMKGNACKRVGMESLRIVLPQTTTTDELLSEIDKKNWAGSRPANRQGR